MCGLFGGLVIGGLLGCSACGRRDDCCCHRRHCGCHRSHCHRRHCGCCDCW